MVRVCVELTVHMCHVQFIDQCGLHVYKIQIFYLISGCRLYTGALNRSKITVIILMMRKNNLLFVFQFRKSHCNSTGKSVLDVISNQ